MNVKNLAAEWKQEVYDHAEDIDERSDKGGACYESMCVGWSLAKGLTVEEAFEFYQELIHLELF